MAPFAPLNPPLVANPNLGEEEAVGCRRWYRSKECWWVPIGPT